MLSGQAPIELNNGKLHSIVFLFVLYGLSWVAC